MKKKTTTDKVLALEIKKPFKTGMMLALGFAIGGALASLLSLVLTFAAPIVYSYIVDLFSK
jgi:putative lipase involved disintegration of autophagic bodies